MNSAICINDFRIVRLQWDFVFFYRAPIVFDIRKYDERDHSYPAIIRLTIRLHCRI